MEPVILLLIFVGLPLAYYTGRGIEQRSWNDRRREFQIEVHRADFTGHIRIAGGVADDQLVLLIADLADRGFTDQWFTAQSSVDLALRKRDGRDLQ